MDKLIRYVSGGEVDIVIVDLIFEFSWDRRARDQDIELVVFYSLTAYSMVGNNTVL
jgi:hypothetical protein